MFSVRWADESLEHLFVSYLITQSFWAEVIKWCSNRGVVINHISAKDILFGKKLHKDNYITKKEFNASTNALGFWPSQF